MKVLAYRPYRVIGLMGLNLVSGFRYAGITCCVITRKSLRNLWKDPTIASTTCLQTSPKLTALGAQTPTGKRLVVEVGESPLN